MTSQKPRLIYFDAPVSRGEECRLALALAGVDFEDVRVKGSEWPALKPTTPFGAMPVLEMPGHPPLGQSNAILVLIGRLHGLHPSDPYEAARHEAMLAHVEDLRHAIGPTTRMPEAEKQAARATIVATTLPAWAGFADKQLVGDGPFFAGAKPHVVDVKLYILLRWLASGTLDHIPATVLAPYPRLVRLSDAVRDLPAVRTWTAAK